MIVHCPDYPVIIKFLLWTHWPINRPQNPPNPDILIYMAEKLKFFCYRLAII